MRYYAVRAESDHKKNIFYYGSRQCQNITRIAMAAKILFMVPGSNDASFLQDILS